MTFKASLFSKGLLVSDLKRFWWVSALYGLFLFLILPFHHMLQELPAEESWAGEMLKRSLDIFSGQSGIQAVLICTVPVILGVLLFQYLHNSRAVAVMHSLPCNRLTLFCSHSVAGLVLLFLPVAITGLVLAVLNMTTPLKGYYSLLHILRWMGMTALFDTLVFALTVFVGMFTGNTVAHLAFTYILQVLPNGLHVLLVENLSNLLYGYTAVNYPGELRYNFPLMMFASGTGKEIFTAGTVAAYILAAAAIFAAAFFIYRLRQAEAAGDVIAFPVLRPVFKYGVTACGMLLAGAYFAGVYRGAFPVIVWGYVLGSFLGYFTAEALLQKSLKIWVSYRGYLGFAAVIALLLLGIATDATGYVRRVPEPEKVQKVYFGTSIYAWTHMEKLKDIQEPGPRYEGEVFFEDRDNIEHITRLHRELVANPGAKTGLTRYIIYTLADGGYLARRYYIDEKQYASFLKPIYESPEYKQARFPVVTQDPAAIKMIEIDDYRVPKRAVILTDRMEIGEFTVRLKQDVLDATFEELTAGKKDYVHITIVDAYGRSDHYTLPDSYRSVINWLKEKGYYEDIVLLPEEVEYAVLENPLTPGNAKDVTASRRVEIRDRRVIEELLNINGSADFTVKTRVIEVIFYGRTTAGPFQFNSFINPDWPVSAALKEYMIRLD
ncbi:DUF6449 domain-containing protein [Moorella sulfitireducens (nom. illeg.)]|uniref:DUF6449 domain-containing protein n=1 Tax=Neomoorella sulfitireducens TaxID=2972948 RepID=UPI0021AC4940|nr:DUF6449 domain-containing protein [Moorella sulfitireducens]